MPVYNNERFVGQAIESVLRQTYRELELIVVDDGSADGTLQEIESYREISEIPFKIIRHEINQGVSAAKNSGIRQSQGEFLAFAASDDLQKPERIERTVEELIRHPDLDMVFFDCEMVDEENRPLQRRKGYPEGMNAENALLFQLQRNHLWSGLVLLRKTPDIWFDTSLPNAVDYELFMRLLTHGYTLKILDESLMWYRVHQHNISGDGRVSKQSVKSILRRLDLDHLLEEMAEQFTEAEAQVAVASAALSADLPEKALQYTNHLARDSVEGGFIAGVSWFRLGDYGKSLSAFQQAESHAPEDAALINNIGVLLAVANRTEEAEKHFQRALTLREGYLDAAHNLKISESRDSMTYRITEKPLRPNFIHIYNYKL
ncbi:glycosyltransferase [Cohnella suwonensis]|uniref:Glycosyltransferase n=1 Tax=Cohnella suwonensis TaxID=696072 RepID=A0ABW0LVG2_9BACL